MSFAPTENEIRRTTARKTEAEFFKQFAGRNFASSPERAYLDEAYKAYVGGAYGASAVYCGLALESFLYERTKSVLRANWRVEDLLDAAVSQGTLSDVSPGPNQISQREAANYILTVRDAHAHHVAGLRASTANRYRQVQQDWGSSIPSWFNELEAAGGLQPTLNSLEPYKRTMALGMMNRTVGLIQHVLHPHP